MAAIQPMPEGGQVVFGRTIIMGAAAWASLVVGAPAAVASPSAPVAPALLTAEGPVIDAVTYNGSGCAPGTAVVAVSLDGAAFTITYSDFLAQTAAGTPADVAEDCRLSVQIRAPQGLAYAISSVDYRGYASLQDGATAVERTGYNFRGNSQATPIAHRLRGPSDADWQFTDTGDSTHLSYGPCGQGVPLDINMELRVNAGSSNRKKAASFITMDSTDGTIKTTFHLASKTCPPV